MAITDSFVGGVLTFTGDGADDTLELTSLDTSGMTLQYDLGAGPVTRVGVVSVSFDGDGGTNSLLLRGSPGDDTIAVNGTTIDYAAVPIALTNVQNLTVSGEGGQDTLSATGVTVVGDLVLMEGSNSGTITIDSLTTGSLLVTDADPGTVTVQNTVTTSGSQTYNSPVSLGADTIIEAGGDLTFVFDVVGPFALTANVAGTTVFNGTVALGNLTTDASGATVIVGGLVATTDSQTYNDPVTLIAVSSFLDAGGDLTFNSTLDGPFDLLASAAGTTTFGGPVTLGSLTTDAAGDTTISGGIVITTGSQLYNDPVTLGADATLIASDLTFASTLDGAFNLMADVSGTTTFGGLVGGFDPLLSLTTDAPGSTDLNGVLVNTLASQTYNDPVTLGTDTLLIVGGDLTFASTVDGPFGLIAIVTGITTFGGAVGGLSPLTFLDLTTGGPLTINQDLTTTDFIALTVAEGLVDAAGDDLTLGGPGGPATLTTIDVLLRAGDNLDLADNSTIIASSSVTLEGDVGDNDVFGSLVTISGTIFAVSATVFTGDDDDLLTINETAPGQLNFSGVSPDGHTNGAFLASGLGPTEVGLHFEAGDGFDSLAMNFILSHDVAYFSDDVGELNSGVINVAGALTLSFDGLSPITMTGAGGTLLVDASSTPATTMLTVTDIGVPGDGVSEVTGDGGFEATTFSGFSSVTVRGGDGGETITLASVDPADPDGAGPGEALTSITLDGDNTTFTDTAGDFLLVQSLPDSIAALLLGGQGDDVFLLDSNGFGAGGTLDLILGPVIAIGEDHNLISPSTVSLTVCGVTKTLTLGDRLLFVDSDSPDDNTYALSDATFQRTALLATGLVTYSSIERVDLLTGSGSDTIDVSSTISDGTTIIDANDGNDVVTVATTGNNSILFVAGDNGVDSITLQSTGTDSAVLLDGGAGDDAINVEATDATTRTQLNGGLGDDTFTLGSPANGLDDLQGTICVLGGADDGFLLNPSFVVCGAERNLPQRDRLVFNDQAGPAGSTYTLSNTDLARTGIATITFETVETVELNTTDLFDDIIDVTNTVAGGTTTINSSGGADFITITTTGDGSNLQVNAGPGDDTITLNNSGANSAVQLNGEDGFDTIDINGTGPGSVTEAHGEQIFVDLGGVQGQLCLFGELPPGPPTPVVVCGTTVFISGPTVVFDDSASPVGHDYVLTPTSLIRDGVVIDTTGFGTVTLTTSDFVDTITVADTGDDSATFINAGDGADVITVQNTGDRSVVQVNAGGGNDTIDVWRTGVDSFTEINGQAGDDTTTLGTPATEPDSLRLDGLLGTLCVFGGDPTADAHDGSAGLNPAITVCGTSFALLQRDRLILNDQDSPILHGYFLIPTSISRDGLPIVDYQGIETFELNTTNFVPADPLATADNVLIATTVADTSTVINTGAGNDGVTVDVSGADTILQINAGEGNDAITLFSSGPNSATEANGDAGNDTILASDTGLGSSTELRGGENNDNIILGFPLPVRQIDQFRGTICVFGGDGDATPLTSLTACGITNSVPTGDTLTINDQETIQGSDYTLSDSDFSRGDLTTNFGTIFTYDEIETVVLNTGANADTITITSTVAGGSTTINSDGGADAITIVTTGAGSNLQVNAGAGDDTITLQNSGAGSAVQLNGEGGFDTININGTGPGSVTEAHGEEIFVDLGGVQGQLCLFGEFPPGPPTSVVICGTTVFISGPTVVFDDSTSPVGHDYILTSTSLTRDGVVIDTIGFGTVMLTTSNFVDTITVVDTGDDTATFINAGDGADVITVQNTGDRSVVQVNAGGGNDMIDVWRTGDDSFTEINGQGGDDTTTLGTPATEPDPLRLDGLQGKVCVFGGDPAGDSHDGTAGLNPAIEVCGVTVALLERDQVVFNDQGSPAVHQYTLAPTSLTRDGLPLPIDFVGIETVILNTSTVVPGSPLPPLPPALADTITITNTGADTSTFVNAFAGDDVITVENTGAGSVLQINGGSGRDTITLENSGANSLVELNGNLSLDQINVWRTATGSRTEINGGDGDDTITLGTPASEPDALRLDGLQGKVCVFGGAQDALAGPNPTITVCGTPFALLQRDRLVFNDQLSTTVHNYTLAPTSLTRDGLPEPIDFTGIETVELNTTNIIPADPNATADTILVTDTLTDTTTVINAGAGNDAITIDSTGDASILQVNAGDGDDTVTLQNSGAASAVEINGDEGNDTINVWATGAMSFTELNGGDGDDTFTLGSPANMLDGLQGTICVFGDGQDGSAGPNPTLVVCGVDRTLPRGDLLVFNDQASSGASTYTLSANSLARTGLTAAITYLTTETVVLNSTAGPDAINIANTISGGTTIINSGSGSDTVMIATTGTDSNLQVNMPGGEQVIVQNSGVNSAVELNGAGAQDLMIVRATGSGSLTELNGGFADDTFILGSPLDALQGTICVFGEGHSGGTLFPPSTICGVNRALDRGDLLVLNDQTGPAGSTYTLTENSLARTGVSASITYMTVESVNLNTTTASADIVNVINTVSGGTTIINSLGGDDIITIVTTGTDSNLLVSPAAGANTITLQNSGTNSGVVVNGAGESNTFNVWATGSGSLTELNGGSGDDTFVLGSPANTLDGLQGTICLFGNLEDGSTGANPPLVVCGVDRALPRGDQLVFNDQSGPAGSTYTLTEGTLARTGLTATITYATTETVVLNTTAANADTINVTNTVAGGTTIVNSSGGDDVITITTTGAASNLQVNAGAGNDTFIMQNSGPGSATQLNGEDGADEFNIRGTGAGSDTQINAGDENDRINIGSPAPYPTPAPGPSSLEEQLARNAADEASATDATYNVLGMVCVNGGADCDELFIRGSAAADTITIGLPGSGDTIELEQVECLSIFAGAGNDIILNNTFTPSLISGGPGDDMLQGGSSADLIFGGSGADTLNGGLGDDFLFGDQDSTGQPTPEPPPAPPGTFSGGDILIGGGGTDNAVSIGVGDQLIDITGMIVEEAAVKNVLTFLRAQFMAFSFTNVQSLFLKGIVTRCECGPAGTATLGLYNPTTGTFFLRNENTPGPADQPLFAYGAANAGFIPLTGDWNGDGTDTPGLYSPANGGFMLRNSNSGGFADWTFFFGPGGLDWRPIVGDWDGDGVDTVGVYHVPSSTFFLKNATVVPAHTRSGAAIGHTGGIADMVFSFGPPGSGLVPLADDWNGDLRDTIGVYNPATGGVFLRNTNTPGPADLSYTFGPGGLGWKPITGDWNSDGIDTFGLQNPVTSRFFLRDLHAAGPADVAFAYGPPGAGWAPLAGDWNGATDTHSLRLEGSTAPSGSVRRIYPADARSAADAALARWAVAGLNQASLGRLAEIDVRVTDLPGDELGRASHGTIYVDQDAAGRGWFVDPTPAKDEEFTLLDGRLLARTGPAYDRADLLSVLIHELGHELGLDHHDSDAGEEHLMAETIAVGTRRVPTPQIVDRIFGDE